jgi:hypothetical protein
MKLTKMFWIAALLIFPIITIPQTKPVDERAKYINYKYKGVNPESILPNGVKHFGGALIGNIDADPVYGISTVAKGRTNMLWLEVSTGRDSTSGVSGWRVLDVLAFPGMTKNDYLFFSNDPAIYCRRNGKDVPDLVGIGKIYRSRGIFQPTKLWVADLKTEKFKSIPIAGVKCEYSEP